MMEIIKPIILLPLVLGPIFFIVGLIQLKFPPKKINHLYGYRTKSSMQSQEVWDFAQQFSAKEMIKGGILFSLLAGIGIVAELIGIIASTNLMLISISTGLILIFLIGFVIFLFNRTEKAINKKFNK